MKKLCFIIVGSLIFLSAVSQSGLENHYSTNSINQKIIQLSDNSEECTIGVALGSATSDGRPMLWKTRDNSSSPNNEVIYMTGIVTPYVLPYSYVCVSSAEIEGPWMGVNEHGFAIVNSYSGDLTGGTGINNGEVMWYVLGTYATIDEFEHFLDSTNNTGRSTQSNFAVIDSTGAGAIYETGGNFYVKYNAEDAEDKYIIRTNFSMTSGGNSGIQRYLRSEDLISDFFDGDSLNPKSIMRYQMRDFSDLDSQPIPVPYQGQWLTGYPDGYIPTNFSICRNTSVSTAVIQGVTENENPALSTLWAIIGNPAASIVAPYWPVGVTPPLVNGLETAPLCDLALTITDSLYNFSGCTYCIDTYKLIDEEGDGLWPCFFNEEDIIFDSAYALLDTWRTMGTLPVQDMLDAEVTFSEMAYDAMHSCFFPNPVSIDEIYSKNFIRIYPNPLRTEAKLEFEEYTPGEDIDFYMFDFMGREVCSNKVSSNPFVINRQNLSDGIYIWKVVRGGSIASGKIVVN